MMQEADDEQILFDQEGLLSDGTSAPSSRNKKSKRSNWLRKFIKTVVLCVAFFALGLCIAIPGPTLLDLSHRVNTDVSQILLIFTARSLGYLLGSIIGGFLFDKFDQLLLLFYTLILTSIATTVAPWCTVLTVLAIMIAFQGISMGVLDTGGNVLCIKIWGRKSAPYMQLLHFAFGVGACIAPLLAEPFLMNPELLAQASNNSEIIKNHPYQGNSPVLVDLEDIKSKFNLEHHLVKRQDDSESFVTNSSDLDAILQNLTDSTTTVPLLLPKKPTLTESSGNDPDGSKLSKNLQKEKAEPKITDEDSKLFPTTSTVPLLNQNTSTTLSVNGFTTIGNDNPNATSTDLEPTTTNATVTSTLVSTTTTPTPSTTTPTPTTTTPTPTTTTPTPTTTTPTPTTPTTSTPTTTTTTSTTTTTTPTTKTTTTPTSTKVSTTKSPSRMITDFPEKSTSEVAVTSTNSSVNTTTYKKPDVTSADLFNSALNALSNMSNIQFAYMIIGLLLAINAVMFLVLYCKETHKDVPTLQEEKENKLRQGTATFRIVILTLLFLFFFVYVGMEVTYGGLLSTFSVKQMNWTEQQGATVTAAFWGSIAAGRGIAILVAKLCSPPCMLIADLFLIIFGAIILCFGTLKSDIFLWIGTLTLGLGMSSLFPTGISWADHYFPLTGKTTGILVVGSSLGEMIVPFITGYISSHESEMALMYSMLVWGSISLIIYVIMQKVASSKKTISLIHTPSRDGFEPLRDDDDVLPLDLIESPTYTNGLTESTRSRQPKIQFKPEKQESNGEYKRLIDFSDQEFS